jgi:hypothetical protein
LLLFVFGWVCGVATYIGTVPMGWWYSNWFYVVVFGLGFTLGVVVTTFRNLIAIVPTALNGISLVFVFAYW